MSLFTPSRRWQPSFYPVRREKFSRRLLAGTERVIKGAMFGCRMCGNCLLQETAFICPMECPKGLRNGPCVGSGPDKCYIDESRKCIWYEIFERAHRMKREEMLLEVLPPLDWEKTGTETWGEVIREARKSGMGKFLSGLFFKKSPHKDVREQVFRTIRQPQWWNGDSGFHPPASEGPASEFEKKLKSGEFVFTTEVIPPLHSKTDRMEKNILSVKPFVSAVNFTDNSSSVPRMSGLICCSLASRLGADPVLQITSRDTTRYGLQSIALGANAAGIRNILCISGDSPIVGPKPVGSMDMLDLDSVQMLWMLRRMRDEKRYLDGREIKQPPEYFLGAAASPFTSKPSFQAIREEKKINAGAQFLQTNLAYNIEGHEQWLEALYKRNVLGKAYILVGVAPLKSMKMAHYLNDEIPGVTVPREIMTRMEKAGNSAGEEGIAIALEFIEKVKGMKGVNGIHLMTMGCEATVERIVNTCRCLKYVDQKNG